MGSVRNVPAITDPKAKAKAKAKAKQKAKIAALYNDRAKNRRADDASRRSRPFSRGGKRVREIERAIADRHGIVPTTDDADLYLDLIANCYHVLAAGRDQPVSVDEVMMRFWGWCQRWAPHTTSDQALAIVRQELAGPPELIGDDVAGRAIRLAYADRMRLKITTIGSYDVDRAGRTKRADDREREADKARKAEERRANGATPRAHSFSQTRPWEAEGLSRSTWERRRKKRQRSLPDGLTQIRPGTLLTFVTGRICVRTPPGRRMSQLRLSFQSSWNSPSRNAGRSLKRRPGRVPDDVIELKWVNKGFGFAIATPPPPTHLQRAVARAYRLQQQQGDVR